MEQTERFRARRAEILQAACDLFSSVGFHQTSMASLAEATGLAKATVYHYFKGKDEILLFIHEEFERFLLERSNERASKNLDPVANVKATMVDIVELIHQNPKVVRVFFQHLDDLTGVSRGQLIAARREMEGLLERHIADGLAQGSIRPDVDPRLIMYAILGMCNWSYLWNARRQYEPSEIIDQFWPMVAHGVLNRDHVPPVTPEA